MTPLLTWMEQNLARELPLPVHRASSGDEHENTEPSLSGASRSNAGRMARARARRRAQRLLETTDLAIEQVAAQAGFGSAVMRDHFGTVVGTSPLSYRRAFSSVDRSA